MAFPMSGNDILKEYREAKDRRAQIQILADLNACSRGEIVDFLVKCGEEVDKRLLPRKREGGAAADTHTHTHTHTHTGGAGRRGRPCAGGRQPHDGRSAAGSAGGRRAGSGDQGERQMRTRYAYERTFQLGRRSAERRNRAGGVR